MHGIIISGPTGSGKTAVAKELALRMNGEILSADSRQVYRHLDVGTNKEGVWDGRDRVRRIGGVPQHITDIIDPSETFSAGDFVDAARPLMERLAAQGKTPLIVGGTGLYIKALCDGLSPLPRSDKKLRDELNGLLRERGREYLRAELETVDPEAALKNAANPQRLLRALEVYRLTGVPISLWHKRNQAPPDGRFVHVSLSWPREELYERINKRSRAMLASGMIEETKRVLALGFPENSPGLQGLGYRDILRHLNGTLGRKDLEDALSRDTRRYAKRQMTWFRKDTRICRIETDGARFDARKIAEDIFKNSKNLL